jgi:hypothetical protein
MNIHVLFPRIALSAVAVMVALLLPGCSTPTEPPGPSGFLLQTNYHGWEDALWLSNGKVEAIIVPSIGRVMEFRRAGQDEGPFWQNPALLGEPADPSATEWKNFGGDKVWPAPQSHWGDHARTNWPPPPGFDAVPYEVEIDGWVVTMRSPIDVDYGVRVTRRIELDANQPVMRITSSFEKVNEPTVDGLSVWVVTQLDDPVAIYAPLPLESRFPQQFNVMLERRPPSVQVRNGVLSLRRDPENAYKIGLDTGSLLWVGEREILRIDSARLPYSEYTDDGASAEIYTSPNPLPYVELEMLSPVKQLREGETLRRQVRYTLLPRQEVQPELEARMQYH